MTFPVEIPLFGHRLHPHPVLEAIAYTGGSQLYFWLRRRARRRGEPPVPIEANLWLLVGCVFGALIGAKLLAVAESWRDLSAAAAGGDPAALLGGKTIVGGLLGGWVGVELAKRTAGVARSTGDLFVFPLVLGIAVGRVGCFLTGLADHTHGGPTALPWAVDFGDGVPRHPTKLYEIAFLLLLGGALAATRWRAWCSVPGTLFRAFLLAYLAFRFAVEFIKPTDKPLLGLSVIQVACLIGAAVAGMQLVGLRRTELRSVGSKRPTPPNEPKLPASLGRADDDANGTAATNKAKLAGGPEAVTVGCGNG